MHANVVQHETKEGKEEFVSHESSKSLDHCFFYMSASKAYDR